MGCAESRELLVEYSLSQLDRTRAEEVRKHLQSGCEMCAKELAEIHESWATIAAELEPVAPSPEIEARLLAMIRGQASSARPDARDTSERKAKHLAAYMLAASLVGVVSGLLTMNFTPLSRMLAQQEAPVDPSQAWGPASNQAATTGFQTVGLNTIAERRGLRVSVIVIPQAQEWHVVVTGLPPREDGEVVQIWLESKSGAFMKPAIVAVEQDGRGGAVFEMSGVHVSDLASIWLTQETNADSAVPSDAVLFRAVLK